MGLFTRATEEAARGGPTPGDGKDTTTDPDGDATPQRPPQRASEGAVASLSRGSTINIGGDEITIEEPETEQATQDGTWLSGESSAYGIPRGIEAVENREIARTSAMQSIINGITDQLTGAELVFETDEEVFEGLSPQEQEAAERLRGILRDVITGPHLQDESLDDLIAAYVDDVVGPGNAYWQLLSPESADLPVVSLTTLPPLTIRHNINEHGYPMDPPYWQAGAWHSGGTLTTIGDVDPDPLQADDVAVLRYPKGHRSDRWYPLSPAQQVKEWLLLLADSTTNHQRHYSDNEIPPGIIQIINASGNTISDVKDKIQDSSGDPRDVPVIGGEGGAQWLDMGGSAVNLNIIQEQEWFFNMCLGALGLGKHELGFTEDANRSNGEIEATRVYKRVTGPFAAQIEEALLQVARQFDLFTDLGEPFTPKLRHSDPREERAREQRLREMYQAGGLSLREYYRRRGDDDLATDDDRFTVQVGDETVNYGDHPKWVAQAILSDAAAGVDVDGGPPDENADQQT